MHQSGNWISHTYTHTYTQHCQLQWSYSISDRRIYE